MGTLAVIVVVDGGLRHGLVWMPLNTFEWRLPQCAGGVLRPVDRRRWSGGDGEGTLSGNARETRHA